MISTYHLEVLKEHLEFEISKTPTGEARNALCDANIHLMVAIDILHKVRDPNNIQPTPGQVFERLIDAMEQDNGGEFPYSPLQREVAECYIRAMQCAQPDIFNGDHNDIDGVYWDIAAGEVQEVQDKYGHIPGFTHLNNLLNAIFNAEE